MNTVSLSPVVLGLTDSESSIGRKNLPDEPTTMSRGLEPHFTPNAESTLDGQDPSVSSRDDLTFFFLRLKADWTH